MKPSTAKYQKLMLAPHEAVAFEPAIRKEAKVALGHETRTDKSVRCTYEKRTLSPYGAFGKCECTVSKTAELNLRMRDSAAMAPTHVKKQRRGDLTYALKNNGSANDGNARILCIPVKNVSVNCACAVQMSAAQISRIDSLHGVKITVKA
ncbi:unnamed protein product [Toxocara canis]|uniref:Uncharacterized protein n=1 Tax=Toxocara canis TaxID=6265 RepID=A0A183UFX4_TOXCA|nr:unnamed protein product [Toxocara canis]